MSPSVAILNLSRLVLGFPRSLLLQDGEGFQGHT